VRIDTYESVQRPGLFLSTCSGVHPDTLTLPTSPSHVLPLREFKMNWDPLEPLPRVAMHASHILEEIRRQGFAIHLADVSSRSAL
jgi:hypothetical protein